MKVKSVKIKNFKSFAEENNLILLDEINTIVGKNESGKSNLVEAISKIDMSGIKDNYFFKNINKNSDGMVELSMVLIPEADEVEKYNINDETTITFKEQYVIEIEGGISDCIVNNKEFQIAREKVNEFKTVKLINEADKRIFKTLIDNINAAEHKILIPYTYINGILKVLAKNPENEKLVDNLNICIKYLNDLYSNFPKFVFLENLELSNKYTREFLSDNTKPKQMLEYLLQAMEIDLESLMEYWTLTKDDDKYNFIDKFNEKIEKIMINFNEFYNQEKVIFKANFENNSINFLVKTSNKYLNLSERSNGLKWYLNMYIQILAKTRKNNIKNGVVLMDEPGVYLHIDAQKELLKLFEDFTQKGNQIIYTTHLPSMIYQDKLYRTRTIIKDENENSNIGNKYYSLPHKMKCKKETITPILTALGMKMGYELQSMDIEKINIVTEGISDYNYLKAFFIQNNYEETFNIIPSSGVSNIHNIISILIGWGYKYKILIDQDKDGRKQYDILTKDLIVDEKDIKFVDGTNPKEKKEVDITIEDLFSENDKSIIGINNTDYFEQKAYYSLEILKKIESKEYKFEEETIENFEKIIKEWIN